MSKIVYTVVHPKNACAVFTALEVASERAQVVQDMKVFAEDSVVVGDTECLPGHRQANTHPEHVCDKFNVKNACSVSATVTCRKSHAPYVQDEGPQIQGSEMLDLHGLLSHTPDMVAHARLLEKQRPEELLKIEKERKLEEERRREEVELKKKEKDEEYTSIVSETSLGAAAVAVLYKALRRLCIPEEALQAGLVALLLLHLCVPFALHVTAILSDHAPLHPSSVSAYLISLLHTPRRERASLLILVL